MKRIEINERDSQNIRRWARANNVTPERVVAWLIQMERVRLKNGPMLSEIVRDEAIAACRNTLPDFAVEEDT